MHGDLREDARSNEYSVQVIEVRCAPGGTCPRAAGSPPPPGEKSPR
jgi:hypothetical protein